MTESSSHRYTSVAITLHWVMALLLGFMIWLGWNMDENEARYQLHKSIGITILFLTIARIGWRILNPPPADAAGLKPLESRASKVVHASFYALMVLLPLGGWLMVSVSTFQIPTVLYGAVSWPHLPFTSGLRSETLYETVAFVHSKGAWVIIALLALHVAGAIKHEVSGEEGVLKRMVPGLFGRAAAPLAPARGALVAFGGSLALFSVIAATSFLGAVSAKGQAAAQPAAGSAITPNWAVDYDASSITFAGVHDGKRFEGVFGNWTADVRFDPEDLASSAVFVRIDTSSARTGTKLYDDSLRADEWFAVRAHPEATVRLDRFETNSEGYRAVAAVQIKEVTLDLPLKFSLGIEDNIAILSGSATLSRKAFNLGQSSDPAATWVADTVEITLSGRATVLDD